MSRNKDRVANLLSTAGFTRRVGQVQARLQSPSIRVVNYHGVPEHLAGDFERQLQRFCDRFDVVSIDELRRFRRGEWMPDRQGLVLTFDDGLRSHAEIAAPLLERYGFQGWFMVPAKFVDEPAATQKDFVREHSIARDDCEYADGRFAMTWDQARALTESHVVGCHTMTHHRMGSSVDLETAKVEISGGKAYLEAKLGKPVNVFAWVGGEESTYDADSARVIAEAGFEFGLMTNGGLLSGGFEPLQIGRTNVEARFSDDVVDFQLSGAMDVMHTRRRRRVEALTALR